MNTRSVVAQPVEHGALTPDVAGSKPAGASEPLERAAFLVDVYPPGHTNDGSTRELVANADMTLRLEGGFVIATLKGHTARYPLTAVRRLVP